MVRQGQGHTCMCVCVLCVFVWVGGYPRQLIPKPNYGLFCWTFLYEKKLSLFDHYNQIWHAS